MSDKPIVFFSHSSRDKRELLLVKELFVGKTGGAIEVFLSSDGQSIPLGRNWVHRIEEALGNAKLLITFITPNSVGSSWVSFEAGFAYSKGVQVVPVGFLGLDIGKVPPPLRLLQGFNITSADGLDNLIALVNDVFHHNHKSRFTAEEYNRIVEVVGVGTIESSAFHRFVDEIDIYLNDAKPDSATLSESIEPIAKLFGENVSFGLNENQNSGWVKFPGGNLWIETAPLYASSRIEIDPAVLIKHAGNFQTVVSSLGGKGIGNKTHIEFSENIDGLTRQHKVSARLADTAVRIERKALVFRSLRFSLDKRQSGQIKLHIEHDESSYPAKDVRDLVQLLYDQSVIWEREPLFL